MNKAEIIYYFYSLLYVCHIFKQIFINMDSTYNIELFLILFQLVYLLD
jgi:hypothetical protein